MSRAAIVAAFCTFAVAHVLSNLVRSANAVLAGDLSRDLVLGPADLGAMSSIYFLVFAAAQLPIGVALDRFGPRAVTATLMLVAAGGAATFAGANSLGVATVGRALIGLGTAAILMGALKAMASWTEPRHFAAWSGTLVAIGSTGSLLSAGPLSAWNATFGWRSAFVATAVALAVVAGAVALFGRAHTDPPRAGRSRSARAVAGGAGRQAAHAAHAAPAHAHDDDTPSPWAIVRSGWFLSVAAMAVTSTGMIFAVQGLWAGPYLDVGLGMNAREAGRVLTALALGVTLGTVALGWISLRVGLTSTTLAASALCIVAQLVLALSPPARSGVVTAAFLVLGGTAAVSTLLFALVRARVPNHVTGRAITTINLFMFGGGFVYQRGIGAFLERGLGDHAATFGLTAAASAASWAAMATVAARQRRSATASSSAR